MIEGFKKNDKLLQENMIACNKPLVIWSNNYFIHGIQIGLIPLV